MKYILIILVMASCSASRTGCPITSRLVGYAWEDNIKNPDNKEYVQEVAFNLGIKPLQVTQKQFNQRYNIK
jgi:hypothetical protein